MEDHKSTGGQVRLRIHLRLQFVVSSLRFQWPKPVMWPSLVSMGQKRSSTSAGQSCLKVTRESTVWVILLLKGSEKLGTVSQPITERPEGWGEGTKWCRGSRTSQPSTPVSAKVSCYPCPEEKTSFCWSPLRIRAESAESQHLLRTAHAISRQQLRMHRNHIPSERSKSILNRHSCSLVGCQKEEGRDTMGNV